MSQVTRIELGCGTNKRPGFFGIDFQPSAATDLVLDIERDPLPFPDSSVEHVYSSHTFEHLEKPGSPLHTLHEIMRVAKDGATVEIWTPYGKSNDAFLLGHRNFYTETHWKHICFEYDDFYFGDKPGRLLWTETHYVLWPGIVEQLEQLKIPFEFALDHLFNVALEFGVILKVDKKARHAQKPQFPQRKYFRQRGAQIETRGAPPQVPVPADTSLAGRIKARVRREIDRAVALRNGRR
jgi:Methyltransferase domain